jgi:hypothetical protein
MERENLTREEAIQQLEETAEDLKREQELFGDLTPPALQQGNGQAPETQPGAAAEDTEESSQFQLPGENADGGISHT